MAISFKKISEIDKDRIIVFDTETTGKFPPKDKILQLTILNGNGHTLFSSYFKPGERKSWPDAEKVNHITYDMVKDEDLFSKHKKEIQDIFDQAKLVVGYNVSFDVGFVEAEGIVVTGTQIDVMDMFKRYKAFHRNENVPVKNSLMACASCFGFSYDPHDAANDASVTLSCFDRLLDEMCSEDALTLENEGEPAKSRNTKNAKVKKSNKGNWLWFYPIWLLITWTLLKIASPVEITSFDSYLLSLKTAISKLPKITPYFVVHAIFLFGSVRIVWNIVKALIQLPRRIIAFFKKRFS